MAPRTTKFDIADHLDDDDAIAVYLSEALATGDAAYITHALGKVARAKGMSKIASASGLGREALYKSLGEAGNPEFATVLKVLAAMKMQLAVEPTKPSRKRA